MLELVEVNHEPAQTEVLAGTEGEENRKQIVCRTAGSSFLCKTES